MNCCSKQNKNKILLFCLLGIGAVAIAIYFFKVPLSNIFTFGFLLLCPLMHFFMMKGHSVKNHQDDNQANTKKEELKD